MFFIDDVRHFSLHNLRVARNSRAGEERGSSNPLSPDHKSKRGHRMSWHWEEGALAVPLNRLNSLSTGHLRRESDSPPTNANLDRGHRKSHKFASGSLHDAAPLADFDHCENERQVSPLANLGSRFLSEQHCY